MPIDRDRLTSLLDTELERFRREHPKSAAAHERGRHSLVGGVPMPWMMLWAGGFPVVAERATGNRVVDVDGHEYVDLAMGDTGAMAGHSPAATVEAVTERIGDLGGRAIQVDRVVPARNAGAVPESRDGRHRSIPPRIGSSMASVAIRSAM